MRSVVKSFNQLSSLNKVVSFQFYFRERGNNMSLALHIIYQIYQGIVFHLNLLRFFSYF